MCFTIAALALGAVSTVYSASEQRKGAKQQADAIRQQAEQAAAQAQETARGAMLAQQTATDRERATLQAKNNAEAAALADAPQVEVATQAPVESARRKTVRASFNLDDDDAGSIRL